MQAGNFITLFEVTTTVVTVVHRVSILYTANLFLEAKQRLDCIRHVKHIKDKMVYYWDLGLLK